MDRISIYKNLPATLQTLYDQPESGKTMRLVYEKFFDGPEQYVSFGHTVGDTILGLHPVTELPKKLQTNLQVDEDTAKAITSELIEFLSPVIEHEKIDPLIATNVSVTSHTETDKSTLDEQTEPAVVTPQDIEQLEPAIEETPATDTSETVKPLRTMAEDMKIVHGYGAYRDENPLPEEHDAEEPVHTTNQDEALEERPSLVNKPNYTAE